MKYLFLILFPFFLSGQVNMTAYGVVGDGNTDDTAALQIAFDSGNDLIANPGLTFLISGQIDADISGNQEIDWNGGVITANAHLGQNVPFIMVAKSTGKLTMRDVLLNGNNVTAVGVYMQSITDLYNVDAQHFFSEGTRTGGRGTALAFRIEDPSAIGNFEGDWTLDGCDCTDINGVSIVVNGQFGAGTGITRCLLIRWRAIPTVTTTITFSNATWDGCWGDDGDLLQMEDLIGGIGASASRLVFDNMILKNFSRRGIKGTSGAFTLKNSTIISPLASNPNLDPKNQSSGMFAIGNFIQSQRASGIRIDNSVFDANGGSWDSNIIPNRFDGLIISNSSFINGADIRFQTAVGDADISDTSFGAGSYITECSVCGPATVDEGNIRFDEDNTYVESNAIQLAGTPLSDYTIVPLNYPLLGGSPPPGPDPDDPDPTGTQIPIQGNKRVFNKLFYEH